MLVLSFVQACGLLQCDAIWLMHTFMLLRSKHVFCRHNTHLLLLYQFRQVIVRLPSLQFGLYTSPHSSVVRIMLKAARV